VAPREPSAPAGGSPCLQSGIATGSNTSDATTRRSPWLPEVSARYTGDITSGISSRAVEDRGQRRFQIDQFDACFVVAEQVDPALAARLKVPLRTGVRADGGALLIGSNVHSHLAKRQDAASTGCARAWKPMLQDSARRR
jgi:hypothetical protein